MRAFLAVPTDPAWAARVEAGLSRVKPSFPPASWTRPESWHLTLRFFADIAPEGAERFADEIRRAVVHERAGELPAGGSVVFPPHGRARVLGLGFSPSPGLDALTALATIVEAAARRVGAAPEDRRYHPHVTLARIRTPWPSGAVERFRREADALAPPAFHVGSVVLFESRLGPTGARHTPLHSFELAASLRDLEVGA
jgi:RNA 2',3'-cyclic 3'-phosphodiesterase